MSPPASRVHGDRLLWAAAALLAGLAGVVALMFQPLARAENMSAPPSPPPVERISTILAALPPDLRGSDRAAEFAVRVDALHRVEAALRRAFASPSAVEASRSPAPLHVARGATPADCLAQAVYYEARGEPAEGQAAVAQVVLNRTRSGLHPADVCGVVFEGAARAGCQFSFACDPRLGGRRPEPTAWRRSQAVASEVLAGAERPELAGALNYHADYVRPRWAAALARTAEIGRHIFYAAARTAAAPTGWSFVPPSSAGA